MKVKKIGWTSFLLNSEKISVLTDPLELKKAQGLFPKTKTDICLFSKYEKDVKKSIIEDTGLGSKVVVDSREYVMEISSPGEYEVGGIMIRRGIGDDFFVIDEGALRIVFMGGTDNTFDPKSVKNLGDVDVLIVPVGDGVNFMDFEKIERVISNIDPAILIPCAYKGESEKSGELKSKEEFIKYFGFANVHDENYLNINKKKVEQDQQSVEVVFLN